MNIGFDGYWAVFNHTSRGNLCRSMINAVATHAPKNKFIIYSKISSENRHLTSLLANPSVIIRQPRYGLINKLWRWGDGLGKDLHRHHVRIYHGLCGLLPFRKGGSHAHWVVSVNDMECILNAKELGLWTRIKEKCALKHSVNMAERIVTPSQWGKNMIMQNFNIDASKIDVVPPCIDTNFSKRVHDDAKKALASQNGLPRRFVLVMGPLEKSKKLLDMVKAVQNLNDKDVALVFMGKSTNYYRHVIRPYVNDHNLFDQVVHVKHLHTVDLPNIYQQATAVLCPAQHEFYSLSMLEAMASGTPVIVNPGTMMAQEAGDAVMVTTDDSPEAWREAIDAICASQELHDSLSARGRDFAAHHTAERTAQALLDCYNKIED